MTPLRRQMVEDLRLRNFSPETQRNYIHYIAAYAAYFRTSPDMLGPEAIREYQLYMIEERKMSPESVNCFTSAAKFLYKTTLELPWSESHFPRSRVPQRLPVVLSAMEVSLFFQAVGILKHRAAVLMCAGGLPRRRQCQIPPEHVSTFQLPLAIDTSSRGVRPGSSQWLCSP